MFHFLGPSPGAYKTWEMFWYQGRLPEHLQSTVEVTEKGTKPPSPLMGPWGTHSRVPPAFVNMQLSLAPSPSLWPPKGIVKKRSPCSGTRLLGVIVEDWLAKLNTKLGKVPGYKQRKLTQSLISHPLIISHIAVWLLKTAHISSRFFSFSQVELLISLILSQQSTYFLRHLNDTADPSALCFSLHTARRLHNKLHKDAF